MRFFFGLTLVLVATSAFAQFANISFWKQRQASLKFTTPPQSNYVLNCSSTATVQSAVVSSPLTVNLSGSGFTFYSDANCATPISSVTIPSGGNSANFYFVVGLPGTKSITASATNYTSATQTETFTANPYIWVGSGAGANWSVGANWSGGVAPSSGDQAIFNGTCVSNCSPSINVSISVSGIRILSGFSGSINTSFSRTVTTGSSGWYQESGSFVGSDGDITHNGPFTLSNGSYTSSFGTTNIGSDFTISGGSFGNTGSIYVFNNRGTISIGSASFNDVSIYPGNGGTYRIVGTMLVEGNLSLSNSTNNVTLTGGTIELKKDLLLSNLGCTGDALIKLTGSTPQSITSTALAARNLPSLEIASTGAVNISGNLYLTGNYTYTSSGTFDAVGVPSTIYFTNGGTASMGSVPYYDVGWGSTAPITFTSDVTVAHNFILGATWNNAGSAFGPGKIKIQGDLVLVNAGAGGTSNLTVELLGTGNQNISQVAGALSPGIIVNSSGGTITFPATFEFNSNFTYLQGTIAGLSTARFGGAAGTANTINSGSFTFNNVSFVGASGSSYTTSGTMKVGGNLTYNEVNSSNVTGAIDLYGNLSILGIYNLSTAITFRGGANQTMSQSGSSSCNMTSMNVNKSAGSLSMLTDMPCFGYTTLNLISGNLDMNGKDFRVLTVGSFNGNTLIKNGGTFYLNGNPVASGPAYGGTVAP